MAKKRARAARQSRSPVVAINRTGQQFLLSGIVRFFPAAISFAATLAYLNSLQAPFLFDDRYHIVENLRIRRLWPIWEIFTHSSRPVIQLSLALNYAAGALHPWGYHALNLAIHICAALVLLGVLRRTFLSDPLRQRWGAAAPWLAGMIALLWTLHPLQTESVTYTIQRCESLMGLFYLLTLYCVIRAHQGQRELPWKVSAVVSCLLGMACKGVMTTAPIMVLLYDRAFLSSSWRDLVRRRKGLYAGLAATWLVYPMLLAQAPAEWKESAGLEYGGVSPGIYAMTQCSVILHYLRLALWPNPLCLDYGWLPVTGFGEALLPGILVGGLLAATMWAWHRAPVWGFLGIWFFLILAPTSSFIPIADIAVEHRMYLPLAAVVALGVGAMVLAGQRKAGTGPIRIPGYALIVCAVLALLMGAMTLRRNADYSSELRMWQTTVRTSPGHPRAQYDLGVSLEHAGQMQTAILHYQKAVELKPTYVEALNNLGHALSISGKPTEGMIYLRRALDAKPDLAEAHCNLGYALAQQGNYREAATQFEEALRLKPLYAEAHNNVAIVLAVEGRSQEAIGHWEEALRTDPGLSDAHNNLAFALAQLGKTNEAIAHFEEAVRIKPDYAQAHIGLAKLLATAAAAHGGNPGRAVILAERACQLTGNRDPGFLDTLAFSYAAANRFEDAVKTAQTASSLARSSGRTDMAREIEGRLQLYLEHRR